MEFVTQNWDDILLVLTSLVTVASVVAKFTPTQTDDKLVAAIWKAINTFALNPKGSGPKGPQ